MRDRLRKVVSFLLAVTVNAAAFTALPAAANAESPVLAGWDIAGETDADSWQKGGYWTNDVTGGEISREQEMLGVTVDYTGCAGTWNQTSVNTSVTKGSLSGAAQVTFDYYATAEPSRVFAAFAGSVAGTYTKTDETTADDPWANVQDTVQFSSAAVDTGDNAVIDGVTYNKYSVTIPLNSVTAYGYTDLSAAAVRENASSFTVGEVRTDAAYSGKVFYDNITVTGAEETSDNSASLDKTLAVYNETVTAAADGLGSELSYQWYSCTNAAGDGAAAIDGADTAEFTPAMENISGWIYCEISDGVTAVSTDKIRVAASSAEKTIELPVSDTKIGDYDLALLNNMTETSGRIDKSKWAPGGYIRVEFTGISDGEPSELPQLDMGTWSVDGKSSQDIQAARHGVDKTTGNVWAEYTYEDMVSAWYNDPDFGDLKALRIKYSGDDKANLTIVSAEYTGPTLSYGDLGTAVSLRGSYSGYQYLFTRHVGGSEFDATTLKEDDFFYIEYAEADADETVNLVAQCHSARADGENVRSTYAVVAPSEAGKTGSGRYAKYTVADIKNAFGPKFRYIDGLRIATSSGENLSANASLYYFEGTGALVDDISKDGYDDAVDVPWTLYDDTDKDGIAVIGASITQNPLVTALAMSGKPFYSPNGSWSAMLDRTDVVTYGIGSQTTSDIAARFHEVLDYDYKQIIIQCGNNDLGAFSDANDAAKHEYNNYKIMLDMVKAKNEELDDPIRVHIISLNPVKSAATNAKIPVVIAKLKELVALDDYKDFVDYTDVFNEFLDTEDENYVEGDTSTYHSKEELVMSDGLHPVAEGYAIYAKYLKPLISITSAENDATLASLSYRMSGDFDVNEAKKVVTGFESGKAANAGGYSVTLPSGTAADATFRLYVSPSNIAVDDNDNSNASVTVNGTAGMKEDEYGNEYAEITLVNGRAAAEVKVTAADGTTTETYNVTFETDGSLPSGYIYESSETKSMDATDDTISGWTAYVQYDVNYTGSIYTGAEISFDITVDNTDFTTMQILLNNAWANLAGDVASGLNVQADQFEDNVYHVEYIYNGTGMKSFASLQIKAGNMTDYRGNISISNVTIKNGEEPVVTMPLSDSKAGYDTAITFPKEAEDTNEYTYQWYKAASASADGTAIDGAVSESFSPTLGELGGYIYCVRTAGNVTQRSEAVPVFADGTEKTYVLSDETQEIAPQELLGTNVLTNLKGGTFNPNTIAPGGYFKVSYTGEGSIVLPLSNYRSETDNKWVEVAPTETGDGYAIFDYDACVNAYGIDFSDLEYINVKNNSNDANVTVTRIEWVGCPVSYGDLGEAVSYIDAGITQGIIGYLYTEHVGGDFRAQDMREDSYFYLEYKGTEPYAVDLAFSSVSGAQGGNTTYAAVAPSESGETGSGYYAIYDIADLREQFGDNFARIDQINITTHAEYGDNGNVTSQATAENAALYYFEGEGAEVEQNKDDVSWVNKPKTGIAFIGDSIVQNPLVTDAALVPQYPAKGDWNAILGRNDVANYGIGGQRSDNIANRFYQLLLEGYDYNTIVMWFGVNDTGLVQNAEEHAARVTENYRKALNQVKGTDKKVLVLSILPTTPAFYEGVQDRIVATNDALKAMCESNEYKDFVTYVDLYSHMLADEGTFDCGEPHADPELFFDGLHPNGKGYTVVADILKDYLPENEYYCDVTEDAEGNITYTSGYSETAAYDMYVAAYDEYGNLVGIEKNKAEGSFDAGLGIKTVKAFFWEKDGMKPLGDCVIVSF